MSTVLQERIEHEAGVTLNAAQVVWTLRYLAALTDPDTDSRVRHKGRVYKQWRGPGRKATFRWADQLVYPMHECERGHLRDQVFELLEELLFEECL